MTFQSDFYSLLIRGEGLNECEEKRISTVYQECGRDTLYETVKAKKILPFAARTFAACGLDAEFWQKIVDEQRKRNRKILACLDIVYSALKEHGVRKMFVSENFGALLSAGQDIALFASGDVDNYADPAEKGKICKVFEALGFSRKARYTGKHQIAAEFFPPKDMELPEKFYISVDFYPLARLKLPCFISADYFVDWENVWTYEDTNVVLPPPDALMYICLLHISLHSFSRAPDIRLYIDILNMSMTAVNYDTVAEWCRCDKTCTRVSAAAELSNYLMKTELPIVLTGLSERRKKVQKLVYNSRNNDLIYEPHGLRVLRIEILCHDHGAVGGLREIFFPNQEWMKKVYGNSGFGAHMRHWFKVL